MQRTWRLATVGLLAVGLGAAACSTNPGTQPGGDDKKKLDAKLVYVDDAKGPAPTVAGAKRGGTITVLQTADFDSFFSQDIYRGDAIMVTTQLVTRTLTGYYEEGDQLKLMGDLATDTGKQSNDCKTWTYTLRDGLKFEDGTSITSKHVAYGISRAYDELAANGPTYIQEFIGGPDWDKYTGPWKNPGTVAPGIETPDDKTIVFNLHEAHCDFPMAAALPTTVPGIPEKDNPGNPESLQTPLASGPYKVKSYVRGERLEFERNPQWDPASDPMRHDYPDAYVFDFTVTDPDLIAKRLVADQGPDKAAISFADPGSPGLADIDAAPAAKSRVIEGETVYSIWLSINTQRITDVDVRRALIYGYNKQAHLQIIGGDRAGKPATEMVSPTNPGHKEYDVYPAGLTGDVEKAKQLLQGKTVPPIKYCYRDAGLAPQVAAVVKEAYARIGIELVLTPLDRTTYYTIVGKKSTDCDLIPYGWGQDYPDPTTFLGVIAHPSQSRDAGSNNTSFLEIPEVGQKLDEYAKMPDRSAAAKLYGDLEEQIMRDYAPWVPIYHDYSYTLIGSQIGAVKLSGTWGYGSLQNAYVNS